MAIGVKFMARLKLCHGKAIYLSGNRYPTVAKVDKEKSHPPKGMAFEWLIQISFCLRL